MSIFDELRGVSCIDAARCLGIKLKREVGGTAWALCPLHGETGHASLFMSADRGWYCYGCHKGGDAVKLYEYINGVDALEAAKMLANDMGIDVEDNYERGVIVAGVRDLMNGLKRQRVRLQKAASEEYLNIDDALNAKIRSTGAEACWDDPEFHALLRRRDALQLRLDYLAECSDAELLETMKREAEQKCKATDDG